MKKTAVQYYSICLEWLISVSLLSLHTCNMPAPSHCVAPDSPLTPVFQIGFAALPSGDIVDSSYGKIYYHSAIFDGPPYFMSSCHCLSSCVREHLRKADASAALVGHMLNTNKLAMASFKAKYSR
jgi:hypothetical protein